MSASTSLPIVMAIAGAAAYLAVLANRLRSKSETRQRGSGDTGSSFDGGSSDSGFWSWLGGDSDSSDGGGGDGGGD